MLKVVKSKTNLIPNLSKIEEKLGSWTDLISSKNRKYKLNLIPSNTDCRLRKKTRSYEEYKKIREEMGFKLLTEEDMKWIDENVYENENVTS